MPYPRETLSQLRARIASDIEGALEGADALLRYSNLKILGTAYAGTANGFLGYLDYIAAQSTPFTATDEFAEAWGALKDKFRKDATPATGTATFPGNVGFPLPANTPMIRGDGVGYVTTADGTVGGGGYVTVPITAVDGGVAGNLEVGMVLTLSSAVSNIGSSGVVASVTAPGTDLETFDDFRDRYLQAYADPPQGGDLTDYPQWAEEVPGVTRAWCSPNGMGPGTVVVRFMMDDAEAAHAGFPQGTDGVSQFEPRDVAAVGDQLLVADYLFAKQPVTALVYAVAPQPNTVNFTISGLSGASTAVKAAIQAAIGQVLLQNGSPGGVTLPDRTPGGIIELSDVEAAIAAVSGSAGFVITIVSCNHGTITPSTNGNITSNTGYLPVLGTVTWV
ncbi:MAG: baseplate J/gp47 family protein [Caulobacteraceae bacterium]